MKKTRTLFLLLFILLFAMPAMASSHTDPFIVNILILAGLLLLASIIYLTAIGGGYKILKTRIRVSSIILGVPSIAIVLFFLLASGTPVIMLTIICFSAYALARAMRMIIWGISAKRTNPPEHLKSAQPKDLFTAAAFLTIVTVILCSFSVAAFQAGILYRGGLHRRIIIRDFMTYELAYSKIQQEETGKIRFDPLIVSSPQANMSVEVEFSKELDSFTLYLAPKRFIPIWPYNYIFTIPAYRLDETGKVRRAYVTDISQHCPANAPVYEGFLFREKWVTDRYEEMKAGNYKLPKGFERKSDD